MSDYRNCAFCHQPVDQEERISYSKEGWGFHIYCRIKANDPVKTLKETELLLKNLEKWQNLNPGWKFVPE